MVYVFTALTISSFLGNNQKVLDQELTGPSVAKINPVAEDKETVTTVRSVVQALSVELIIVEIFTPEPTGLQTAVCQLEVRLHQSNACLIYLIL